MTTNEELFTRALGVIPGGVDSPVRAYGSVGGVPPFITSAKGAYVKDATGREYVDLVCSWGPALLGHSHPAVIEAVQKAAAKGLSFGAPTEAEVELAELIRGRVSAAERIRFVSTGTEATMTAMRLARGATGRDLIVKFAGCYTGILTPCLRPQDRVLLPEVCLDPRACRLRSALRRSCCPTTTRWPSKNALPPAVKKLPPSSAKVRRPIWASLTPDRST